MACGRMPRPLQPCVAGELCKADPRAGRTGRAKTSPSPDITRYEDLRSIQQSWRNARNITKPKKTRYQTHRAGRPEESMFKRYLEWSSGPLQGVERWRRTCHCDCSWRRFPTFERFRTGQTGDPVTQMPRPLWRRSWLRAQKSCRELKQNFLRHKRSQTRRGPTVPKLREQLRRYKKNIILQGLCEIKPQCLAGFGTRTAFICYILIYIDNIFICVS